jgi:hypothetical protein
MNAGFVCSDKYRAAWTSFADVSTLQVAWENHPRVLLQHSMLVDMA